MFLHLQVPGFHAVVHQARSASLRGRPVAVAVDAGPQAPLFATSPEARVRHVEAGMRADDALRRCPDLQVMTPDPEAYRDMQRRLTVLCAALTTRVGGSAGRLDLDLSSPERSAMGSESREQIATVAATLRRHCARELKLDVYLGGGQRLVIARLAAALARGSQWSRDGVVVINPDTQAAATDLLPIVLLTDCDAHIRELLERCGVRTIGQLRVLSADALLGLVGPGGAQLYDVLHGLRDEVVPDVVDPEPSVTATCRAGEGGAGPEAVQGMIRVLAREITFRLRERHLGCTRLTLAMAWCDGHSTSASADLRYQTVADHAVAAATEDLITRHYRLAERIAHLRLTAAGLCAVELQQEWLQPERMRAAEPNQAYDAVLPRRSSRGISGRHQIRER